MPDDVATVGRPSILAPVWERRAIPLDDLSTDPTRFCWKYWASLCAGRPFPLRSELRPRELAPVLRNVAIIRVLNAGLEFDPRIVGDFFVQRHGASPGDTTASLEKEHPGLLIMLNRVFKYVYETHRPLAFQATTQETRDGSPTPWGELVHETACFPLGELSGGVDHILMAAGETSRRQRKGQIEVRR